MSKKHYLERQAAAKQQKQHDDGTQSTTQTDATLPLFKREDAAAKASSKKASSKKTKKNKNRGDDKTSTLSATPTFSCKTTKPTPPTPVVPKSFVDPVSSGATGAMNGPARAYSYWDYEAQMFGLTTDIWAAKQISNGFYDPVWVWLVDGSIDHVLTAAEIEKYLPSSRV